MNKFVFPVFGLFLLIVFSTVVSAQIVVKTTLDRNIIWADGETIYTMKVWADTTNHPELNIIGTEWDVVLPTPLWDNNEIEIVGASLPTQNDFFEGWEMDPGWNRVDSSPSVSGELTDNVRATLSIRDGPSNKQGYLGEYYFKVYPGFRGTTNFDMNDIRFTDTNFIVHQGSEIQIVNKQFRVFPGRPPLALLCANGCW